MSWVKPKASTIEMPPRNPPQVIIRLVLGTKSSFFLNKLIGIIKEAYLQIKITGMANKPSNNIVAFKYQYQHFHANKNKKYGVE